MSRHAEAVLSPADLEVAPGHPLRRVPAIGVAASAIGAIAALVMGWGDLRQLLHSYAVGFLFWLSLCLGALAFVLIQHAVRAGWSVVVRRLAENLMGVLPLFAVLFLPLLAGMRLLYPWSDASLHDPNVAAKSAYLNPAFFVIRAAVIFAIWIGMALFFRGRSIRQDGTGDVKDSGLMRKLAAGGIVVYAFTVTFAAFDWIMSMQPRWYSTIFGGYFWAGCHVSFFAAIIVTIILLQGSGVLSRTVTLEHFYDLGKLLFAFVVFWAYIAFSQFMLIWYGNLPEETIFYEHRFQGSWLTLSKVLLFGHFLVPFFFLMPRTVKRTRPLLLLGALWMLLMQYVDLYWLVMPNVRPDGVGFSVMDLATWLAVGGVVVAAFARLSLSASLVPLKDPRLTESVTFVNA